jgi:hypothetical protein
MEDYGRKRANSSDSVIIEDTDNMMPRKMSMTPADVGINILTQNLNFDHNLKEKAEILQITNH